MTAPEIRYARTRDGISIAYQYIDGREPVVFNPPPLGYQFERTEPIPAWRQYREAFRGDNAWVILDYRGVGLSGGYPGSVSIEDFSLDVEAVADAVAGELVLVPPLDGIGPAVEFVLRHPERVRGMLLRSPLRATMHSTMLRAMSEDLEHGILMLAQSAYEWDSDDQVLPIAREWARSLRVEEYWEAKAAFRLWNLEARVRELQVPVLLRGGADEEAELTALGEQLPNARVRIEDVPLRVGERSGRLDHELIEPWLRPPSSGHVQFAVSGARLTTRQREVLGLVAEGLTNRAIAEQLSIAPGTVARHVSAILTELQLENRTQLARYAAGHGLVR